MKDVKTETMKKSELIETAISLVEAINEMPPKERTEFIYKELEPTLKELKVRENDVVSGLMYRTKDLTQFKFINENRVINENSAKIEKLANSIRFFGVIAPVVVNEEFGLADGQRRITAIRRHALPNPVDYVIKAGVQIDEITDMNSQNERWNFKDFLHRYVSVKREDYVLYAELAKDWEQYVRSRSLRGLMMLGRLDALPTDIWERGQFTIDRKNLPMIKSFMELLKRVYLIGDKDNIFAKDRNFQKALWDLYSKTPKLDIDRLLVKLRVEFNRINIKTDYKTYKKILSEIYNKRLPTDKHHMVVEEEAVEKSDDGQLTMKVS